MVFCDSGKPVNGLCFDELQALPFGFSSSVPCHFPYSLLRKKTRGTKRINHYANKRPRPMIYVIGRGRCVFSLPPPKIKDFCHLPQQREANSGQLALRLPLMRELSALLTEGEILLQSNQYTRTLR